jgi:nucleoside-diphosphate-sugar epimerase
MESTVIEGTRNVIRAAGEDVRVVYVSSLAAIGAADRRSLLSEGTAYNLHDEPGL